MFYPKICWLFNKTDEFSPLFKVICIYNTVITHLPCLGSRLPITTRETTFYHRVMLPHILKIVAELVKLTIIVLKLIVYMLQVVWIRVTGLFSSTARVIHEEFISFFLNNPFNLNHARIRHIKNDNDYYWPYHFYRNSTYLFTRDTQCLPVCASTASDAELLWRYPLKFLADAVVKRGKQLFWADQLVVLFEMAILRQRYIKWCI